MNCSQSSYNFLPKERNSNMDNQVHNQIVSFIWGIADDCLRDIYVRGKYRDVILPMTVIRRLDAMLEDSKAAVLDMKKKLDAAGIDNQWPALCNVAGQAFCNASPFRLKDLREMAKKGFIQSLYRGIRERSSDFRFDVFAKQYLPVPPRDEQDQIVHFLDWKVSEINKLINIRKRQITELEELKRSKIGNIIMGQTLDVPQKETGVSWVKSIPAHWEERSLIQVAEEQQIKNAGMVEDNLLSLSYGKIINKDINTTDGLLPVSFEGYQIINSGNIVLRLTDLQNDHRSLRTGLATQRGIITSAYTCLKARDNILPEYLQLQLHVADLCKVFYGMGGGVRQSIGFKDIRRLIVAIPPLDEQRDILKAVNSIEVPINSVIAKYQEIILSLEELKTKLISDVITGKIDVRDVVIPDYEYVDEEVDFDDEGGNEETEEEENS